jgi:2-C-methyl-D-erythritol 4-phosphate cytidylyltransferase
MPDVIPPGGEKFPSAEGVAAIIPAAGAGIRMGLDRPKQFMPVGGVPVLGLTIRAFQQSPFISAIFVAVPASDIVYTEREIVERLGLGKVRKVVAGGARRQDSVRLALGATGGLYPTVVIHDGVRPLVDQETIAAVVRAGRRWRSVTVGYPATDTVKEVDSSKGVIRTLDRRGLWYVQTPQLFRYSDIMEAHERALKEGWLEVTDDSSMVERIGIRVQAVMGPRENIKITFPEDLELMEFIMKRIGGRFS